MRGFLTRAASGSSAPGGLTPSVSAGLRPARTSITRTEFLSLGGHSSTRGAGVGSFRKGQCVLGSRSALCAVHGGVRRVYEVEFTAVPAGHVDEGLLGRSDRGVGGLACHGGPGEELRAKATGRRRASLHVQAMTVVMWMKRSASPSGSSSNSMNASRPTPPLLRRDPIPPRREDRGILGGLR